MASITWPATIPQYPIEEGYARAPFENSIESETDTGAPLKRRRFSAQIDIVSVTYVMTATQKGYFDTFFRTTSYEGVLKFNWPDPQGSTRDAQIIAGSVQIVPQGMGYRVSFQLRVFL